MKKTIFLMMIFLANFLFAQTTWYLDPSASGTGSGTTKANACSTLAQLFGTSIVGGDEVLCYNGVLTEDYIHTSASDFNTESTPIKFYAASGQDSVVFKSSSSQLFYSVGTGSLYLEFHGIRFEKATAYLFRELFATFYNCEFYSSNNNSRAFSQVRGHRFYNCLLVLKSWIFGDESSNADGYPSDNIHWEMNNCTIYQSSSSDLVLTSGAESWYRLKWNNTYIYNGGGNDSDYAFAVSAEGSNNYYNGLLSVAKLSGMTINEATNAGLSTLSHLQYQMRNYYLSSSSELRGAGDIGQDVGFLGSYGIRGGN